jgi:multiple sugar transport system substrate-binding protein
MVSLLISSTLAACSKTPSSTTGSTDTTGTTETEKKEKVTITFWHNWQTGPSGESMKQSVEQFNKTHENIVVKPLYVATDGGDSITSKMLTAVAGGNPPEVVLSSRYGIAEYMDAVTILNDVAAKDGVKEDMFYPWAWKEATYEGQLLGLPYDGTSRALFYNKDHFKEAGLDPENPPKTIEELEEAARKLTKKEGNRYTRFGLIPWFSQGWLYSWGWSYGGEFLDESTGTVTANDPKIVDALTWMTDFAKEYGMENVTSFVSSAGSDATDPFITGQLSMKIDGNWVLAQIAQYKPDLNFGVANIPSPDGKINTTFVGGRALVIPKGVKDEKFDAAWEFVKWMCATKEGQSIKKVTGEFPAMPDITEELYKGDELQKVFIDVLPNGKNRPVILAGNMMWDELAKAPDLVMNNQGTPKEILDQITKKINDEIAKIKAQTKK